MTCQHCQTWVGDNEHRCPRCGRRVRAVPARISPNTFPIAATATAVAYDFPFTAGAGAAVARARYPEAAPESEAMPEQQRLFVPSNQSPRVIAFDAHATPAEREAIRARAPKKAARRERTRHHDDQTSLDLFAEEMAPQAKTASFCRLEVAPFARRFEAAAVDFGVVLGGVAVVLAVYCACGGTLIFDKHLLPFLLLAVLTVPLFYKLLWSFAGRDTLGMQRAGIRLVDLDGQAPSISRRYQRLGGTVISLAAAGIGIVWGLVDEDRLTWHDHISGTFPTLAD